MAVFCPPDNTCDHCGEEFPEGGPLTSKIQVFKNGAYYSFCMKCFPKLYPGVQVPEGWKRHFSHIVRTASSGCDQTSTM